jgi:hypothetical protein
LGRGLINTIFHVSPSKKIDWIYSRRNLPASISSWVLPHLCRISGTTSGYCPIWVLLLGTHFVYVAWVLTLDTNFGHAFWERLLGTHLGYVLRARNLGTCFGYSIWVGYYFWVRNLGKIWKNAFWFRVLGPILGYDFWVPRLGPSFYVRVLCFRYAFLVPGMN